MSLAKELDALLPQTQCGECGYPGCQPYAEALAAYQAPIDRCPPGGIKTLKMLGQRLNIDPTPYLQEKSMNTREPSLAYIREAECIGCTKCIQACPVDAIIGSATLMHSILTTECTGCGLCVEPCPVDCIEMVTIPEASYDKNHARARFHAKKIRNLRDEHMKAQLYREKRQLAQNSDQQHTEKQAKQTYILAALERAKNSKNKNKS